jgi:hypothetical protein
MLLYTKSLETIFLCFVSFQIFIFLFLYEGWVLPKLSRPIRVCVAFCFFGLGCFPIAAAMGQVGLFLVNQHGAMLAWVRREWGRMLEFPIFCGCCELLCLGYSTLSSHFLSKVSGSCEYLYWLRVSLMPWAGELVCGCRIQMGLRKLRPHVELQPRRWGNARALATEQKRNVQLDLSMKRL